MGAHRGFPAPGAKRSRVTPDAPGADLADDDDVPSTPVPTVAVQPLAEQAPESSPSPVIRPTPGSVGRGASEPLANSFGRRHRRRRLGFALLGLSAVAVALTAADVWLERRNWAVRYGSASGWTAAEWWYFDAGWLSVISGQLVGLWLWWRAPRNPTGRWLWLAGVALGLFLLADYWPSAWAPVVTFAACGIRPALAMAVLGWPTGRPSSRVRHWIFVYGAASIVLAFGSGLFSGGLTPVGWPGSPLSPWTDTRFSLVLDGLGSWLTLLGALAAVVVLVRRRLTVPPAARRMLTPVVVGGVIIAGSDIVTVLLSEVARPYLSTRTGGVSVLGAVNLTQNYGQVAVAALALLVSRAHRIRTVPVGVRHGQLELGAADRDRSPTDTLRSLLRDPTASVVYPWTDDGWVRADGTAVATEGTHRVITSIVDDAGDRLAGLDLDDRRVPHPLLLEVVAADVTSRLTDERAAALARARRAELMALQESLLRATDEARRRLERNLHDGAQQRLVGVTLAARLAARSGSPSAAEDLRAELSATSDELISLIDSEVPPVLTEGLARAVTTVAATALIPVHVDSSGDLEGSDPTAQAAWFIIAEAVTNTVKHANATTAWVRVRVHADHLELSIIDDGRGGLGVIPRTIQDRVADGHGSVRLLSPAGGGTEIHVHLPRLLGANR